MTRSTHIQIRLTEDEKARLSQDAERAGMTASEYVRRELGLEAPELTAAREAGARAVRRYPDDLRKLADLEARTKQLHAQGYTTPVATRMAEAELNS